MEMLMRQLAPKLSTSPPDFNRDADKACRTAPSDYHEGMTLIVALVLIGLILVVLETFLPGMVLGIAGVVCLVAAVVIGFRDFGPSTGVNVLMAVGLGLCGCFVFYAQVFPSTPIAKALISQRVLRNPDMQDELLHARGTTLSALRPSGMAMINGKRFDVVSEGGFIEPNTPIEVIDVDGARIVARKLAPEA